MDSLVDTMTNVDFAKLNTAILNYDGNVTGIVESVDEEKLFSRLAKIKDYVAYSEIRGCKICIDLQKDCIVVARNTHKFDFAYWNVGAVLVQIEKMFTNVNHTDGYSKSLLVFERIARQLEMLNDEGRLTCSPTAKRVDGPRRRDSESFDV